MIARTPERRGPGRPERRGITIVEIIVVMTVVAAMLGLCVIMLQLLMKLEADGRARRDAAVAVGRLSEQFRADVHSARSVIAADRPGAGGGLRIEEDTGRTVVYKPEGREAVVRVETGGGKTLRRERYELPRCGPVALAVDRDGDRQFARLTLDRRATRQPDEPPRSFEILALVGKNRNRSAGGGKP